MVILLTGGAPPPQSAGREAARRVRSQDIRIITVGTSSSVAVDVLMTMSSEPHEPDKDYFTTVDGDRLTQTLATAVCAKSTTTAGAGVGKSNRKQNIDPRDQNIAAIGMKHSQNVFA